MLLMFLMREIEKVAMWAASIPWERLASIQGNLPEMEMHQENASEEHESTMMMIPGNHKSG
jgi:hypothetical protein